MQIPENQIAFTLMFTFTNLVIPVTIDYVHPRPWYI